MTPTEPASQGSVRRRVQTFARRLAGDVPGRYWLLLAGLFVLGYLYWHQWGKPWTGDSLYYTAMTFQYAGHDLNEAIRLTGEYFNDPKIDRLHYGFEDPVISPLIYPRVVYPALSVPFVMLMGGTGMYVVPLLSAMFIVWGLMRLMTRLFTKEIALAVTAVFILTHAYLEFMTGMFTEAPALAFTVAILMMLPLGGKRFGVREAVACSVLLVLVTFSRQSGPVLVSAICFAWLWTLLRRRRFRENPWNLPVLVLLPVGLACTLVMQWWAPYDVLAWFVKVNNQPDTITAIKNMPEIFWKLTVADTKQYFVRDLGLFGIWCAALISVLARPKSVLTALLVGSLLPSMLLSVLNSTVSSFRYYLPMYPILVLAAAGLVHHLLVRPPKPEAGSVEPEPENRSAGNEMPKAVVA
ncbi:hypothetical protein [Actinoplanes aureus]|uniref:Uncharacterized protein n=1 Tax=Actinoplanes aureus TaxID=2792083 RepID=A0A931CC12_9ACTN|nr:hypothetical protein [Actinoplanes aureus]MBG0565202.1 hypothetical protein [Actinoplanes aureus]